MPPAVHNVKIGQVKDILGNWCRRRGPQLKRGEVVYLDDEVYYCNAAGGSIADQITIIFDRVPPYEEVYKCSTPGTCSHKANLWLQGAYLYGGPPQAHPTPLISTPPLRGAALPDLVLPYSPKGLKWPDDLIATVSLTGKQITVCRVQGKQLKNCVPNTPSQAEPTLPVSDPGLYAIYENTVVKQPNGLLGLFGKKNVAFTDVNGSPAALLLVTNTDSSAPYRWDIIPVSARVDPSADAVQQRRLYLLDLYEGGEAQTASKPE